MPKVLIADKMSEKAKEIFVEKGLDVDVKTGLDKDELISVVEKYDGIVVRSSTKITEKVLKKASNLKIVGRAGIGVDNIEDFDYLNKFVSKIKEAGCKTIILHARKAILKGLTPKQNLSIPKLNYERVYEIKKENPDLEVIINGGITNTEDIKKHLEICDGVMIGRAIYQNPYFLSEIEKEIFNTNNIPSREDVAKEILKYLEEEVKAGAKVNHIMRHTVGLYHGQPGSKDWKRYLSDNMMARDSDFQKAKHIMTIVQNNEKANQVNT